MSDNEAVVEVRIPPEPTYIRVVRLASSGVAAMAGLDVERIEDLKIAVDEMCSTVMESGGSAPILVSLQPPTDRRPSFDVVVESDCDAGAERDEHRFSLSRTIVAVIADRHELSIDGGRCRYEMSIDLVPAMAGGVDDASMPKDR